MGFNSWQRALEVEQVRFDAPADDIQVSMAFWRQRARLLTRRGVHYSLLLPLPGGGARVACCLPAERGRALAAEERFGASWVDLDLSPGS